MKVIPDHVGADAVCLGGVFHHFLESAADQIAIRLVEIAHSPLESGFGGHHVPHMAAVHFGNGQHQRVEGRDVAAHDGLQAQNNTGERFDGPGALVRVAGVGALGVEGHAEFHAAGHHRLNADGQLAGRIVGVVVRADNGFDIVHESGVDHGAGALAGLLAGLEQDFDRPCERVTVFGEPERGAEQAGHVQVVAAAVHHALVDGTEVQSGVFHDGQAVDVSAQPDTRPGTVLALNEPHNTSLQRVVQDLDAVCLELVGQIDAGVEFAEAAFRVGVQVVADSDEFVVDVDVFTHSSQF